MNTQELINKIGRLYTYGSKNFIERKEVIDLVKQLDEPQKPVVKRFVADWYEEHKEELEFNIWDWIKYTQEEEKIKNRQFTEWLAECENDPVETLIKMKLFGYEVEKEKRYLVKLKGEIKENLLVYGLGIDRYFFARTYDSSKRNEHTHKELEEAGFGWVFDCPGVEVEEVEG